MKSTLIDTGPLVALFDRDDAYHDEIVRFLETFHGNLVTTWPVVTETSYLLRFNAETQVDFFEWLKRDAVQLTNIEKKHLERIVELITKYSDIPMDLADASLIVAAESMDINDIVSIDTDYFVYRTKSRRVLNNLLQNVIRRKG